MSTQLMIILGAVVAFLGFATWKAPRLTSVLLWSLTATITVTAAALLVIPYTFSDLALWITLAVPLVWVVFQFLCYWTKKSWHVATGLITLTIVSGIVIYLVEPPV